MIVERIQKCIIRIDLGIVLSEPQNRILQCNLAHQLQTKKIYQFECVVFSIEIFDFVAYIRYAWSQLDEIATRQLLIGEKLCSCFLQG